MGIICPLPVGTGLTDLPNIEGGGESMTFILFVQGFLMSTLMKVLKEIILEKIWESFCIGHLM